jgi:hypothetical protein
VLICLLLVQRTGSAAAAGSGVITS